MVINGREDVFAAAGPSYDRKSKLKAFDDTKAGVKGLVEAGIDKVPQIFIPSPDRISYTHPDTSKTQLCIPVIDLDGIENDPVKQKEVVDKIRAASETWGFRPSGKAWYPNLYSGGDDGWSAQVL